MSVSGRVSQPAQAICQNPALRVFSQPKPVGKPEHHTSVDGIIRSTRETKRLGVEMMWQLTGVDITVCPRCRKGRMQLFFEIPESLARSPNPLAFAAS